MSDFLLKCPFSTGEDAIAALRSEVLERQFAVAKRRTKKDESGNIVKYEYECVKGRAAPTRGTGQRLTGARRDDCPWQAIVR